MSEDQADRSATESDEASTALEVSAGVVAALVSLVVPEPMRGVVAHGLAPVLSSVQEHIYHKWNAIRIENSAHVIEDAAFNLGISPEGFLDVVREDPKLLALTAQAMNVAASTVLQQKIKVLGRLVANGVQDEAKVDESVMFLAALQDIEAPHIDVLLEMGTAPQYGRQVAYRRVERGESVREARYKNLRELQATLPRFGDSLQPVVSTLERHGLIESESQNMAELLAEYQKALDYAKRVNLAPLLNSHVQNPGWRITEFGLALRDYLGQQGTEADGSTSV